MSEHTTEPRFVRIELTPAQREQVKAKTGRDSQAIELTSAELEERIVPVVGWTGNHNETLAVENLEERITPQVGWGANHNETMLDDR